MMLSSNSSSTGITTTNYDDGNVRSSNSEWERRHGISWDWKRYNISSSSASGYISDSSTGSNSDSIIFENTTTSTPSSTTPYNHHHRKILIAQYDAGVINNNNSYNSTYATILNITSHVNQLYALQYQCDYVLLRGIVFRIPFYESTMTKNIPSSRATYNKVYILEKAIQLQYDYLLLLDSDAMIYDFHRNIHQSLQQQLLLPFHKMIVAHQVGGKPSNKKKEHYNINIGVTLWNLHHTMIHIVLKRWKILSYLRIILRFDDNDQNPLQNILHYLWITTFNRHFITSFISSLSNNNNNNNINNNNEYLRENVIEENYHDFAYQGGTYIKHFIRGNSKTWKQDETHHDRVKEIQKVAYDICTKHELTC